MENVYYASLGFGYKASMTNNKLRIDAISGKSGIDDFLKVPFEVYKGDRHWVPPLFLERKEHLDPKKNPYFKHAEAQLFVAYLDGRPVGRISAQIDQLHLDRYKDATGQFGFLDAVDDADVFGKLFNAAETWLKQRSLARVLGPFSFSINDESGLLIDGFDRSPNMMMGHALPYAARHVEQSGYRKAKDLLAYEIAGENKLLPLLDRAARRAQAGSKITVRPLNKKKLKDELAIIMRIFNDAWSDNWGFVPFTADEIRVLGNNLKILVSGGYIAIAEYQGEAAAMAVTLPNLNEWVHDLNGKLLPFGWAKLAYRLMASTHTSVRLPLMGVLKKYHGTPAGSLLAMNVIEAVRRFHASKGVTRGELSWILEDNQAMRSIIEASGAKAYKTYRVYEKSLA
jgi:hypothetical protein